MIAAAVDAAIGVMETEPQSQIRLRNLANQVRGELRSAGLGIASGDSPIIPIGMETESAALNAADALMNDGILSVAIRPPTVPRGTSRLRVTLSARHTDGEVDHLIRTITRSIMRAGAAYR
jgi:8-amino-7-oxononanoate synthase